MNRKIIQITSMVVRYRDTESSEYLVALCDDGSLWKCDFETDKHGWVRFSTETKDQNYLFEREYRTVENAEKADA
jgi:hypothetical protein